jgi:PDDEXK-like domain of unknown function (DUF3799)
MITEPGVYDIPDSLYHADPVEGGSLSSTGARRLLPPSCPAKFRWLADHPEEHTTAFDLGKAAHCLLLGVGPDLIEIEADNYKTKKAQQQRDDAYAEGAVPLLPKEYTEVVAMAEALRAHEFAGELFAPGAGRAEQTLVWRDRRTGIMRRARLDYLPYSVPGARMLLPDFKSGKSAEPAAINKAIYDYGYYMQGDWYVDGVFELGLAESIAFMLVFQEKTPPYVVTVAQLHPDDLLAGHVRNDYAIDVYRRCVASGRWPGYSDKVVVGRMPIWAQLEFERARERGDYALTTPTKEKAAA